MPHIFRTVFYALLLSILLCTQARAADSADKTASGRSFGSQAVLEACWTPDALAGDPLEDRRIKRLSRPDLSPPQRLAPQTTLQPLPPALQGSIRSVIPQGGRKVLALSFDVCERSKEITGYDAAIVNYLRTQQVRATFYAGGKWLRNHPEKALQLMADPLFELGNHAWTHGNLRVLRGERMRQQILWTQSQYELLWEELALRAAQQGIPAREMARIPRLPLTFRFPYGTCSPEALQSLAGYGLPAIQWSVVTGDPSKHAGARAIADAVLRGARPGAIVICHANGRGWHTAAALPLFVPQLRAKDYAFVTVSELLQLGAVQSAGECYENRPGDNKRYDTLFGEGV